ncbi:MAG TPA: branched-chain amino acid ABC transporter permease/ATP-binding protein [Acidimicrobiales bacterium]|nr:branched-chain amino acid ABC transporter permease/ATP-binding protein [Acidimicrobiales bacterium]
MPATLLTPQVVFDGLVSGLVFGLLAMGIVLVYRATRVINFAVGNMGVIGAGLIALLVLQYQVPFWLAVLAGLAAGVTYGAVVELVVIRRLFDAPRVIVLVATIGIAQLSLAILASFPKISTPGSPFPLAIGSSHTIGSVQVSGPELMILIVVPIVALLLGWFLNHTVVGKSVKASAENPDLARLAGISPKRVSTMVWAIAGALATLSLTLVVSQGGSADQLAMLGPATLVRSLAAAVIAGMSSFWRAFVAGIVIGVAEALVTFNFLDQPGLTDFLVLVAVLIAVYFQSRQPSGETENVLFVPKRRPIPERLAGRWWARNLDRAGLVGLGVVAVVVPVVVTQPSRHLLYTTILAFALAGLSLTILTGWLGQVSLGQMAFAGIGAFLAAAFHRGVTITVGFGSTQYFDVGLQALGLGPSVLLAAAVTAALAALIGLGALRVRGLLLAVSTFAFAEAASQFLYNQPILSGGFTEAVPFTRNDLFGLDLTSQRTYYFVVLAVFVLITAIVARLRRTGIGRTTIGVRDNPDAAAAYTVSSTRVKLRTFALAGGMAGLAGALLAGATQQVQFAQFFTVGDSLALVSIVVIGGLGSIAGPILGALWVIGLPSFFPGNDVVPLLSSSVGLLFLLLYFPGGLIQIAHGARDALFSWVDGRLGPAPVPAKAAAATVPALPERPAPAPDVPALQTRDLSVHFGGIAAVDVVSISVGGGEIVGLIGTNGAGKSTLMNAVGGFVRASGQVELFGERITSKSSVERARRGLGRTFQAATLFPELTVRETVQLALEARGRSGLLAASLCLPRSLRLERRRSTEADEIIDFLGLGRYAASYISDLSTGTRRIVELAGLLALDARLLCLDEPTAGLAQRETEAFGPLIKEIRRELGASVLVIEHDMPLIMGISDRVYCLELGHTIAEGTPEVVRRDPGVIASYLGTDERAIARSGAVTAVSSPHEGGPDG